MNPAHYAASTDIPIGRAINAHIAGLGTDDSKSPGVAGQITAAFVKQLNNCLNLLRSLIEEMMVASKLSDTAKNCFYPIIRRVDDELVRLEIWASDIGFEDPNFGKSSRGKDATLTLTRHMTRVLEDISNWLTGIGKNVDVTCALIKELCVSRFNDFKLNRKLKKILKMIESENELVALAVRNLVKLTEAFRLEQANELGIGPLAELQAEILNTRKRLSQEKKLPIAEPSRIMSHNVRAAHGGTFDPNSRSTEPLKQGPWARSNILTLDGSGKLAFCSLLVLKELMIEISKVERETSPVAPSSASPLSLQRESLRQQYSDITESGGAATSCYLPCHYFDYVGGVGFGGIVAIMLGRMRMPVNECLEACSTFSSGSWREPRVVGRWLGSRILRADNANRMLYKQLKHMVSRASQRQIGNGMFRQPNPHLCRTAVTAFQVATDNEQGEYVLFCSYDQPTTKSIKLEEASRKTKTLTGTWSISQIGFAAAAEPSLFTRARIIHSDGTEHSYLCGSLRNGDPTPEILTLAAPAGESPDEVVSTIVSLGTSFEEKSLFRRSRYFLGSRTYADERQERLRMKARFKDTSLEYVRLEPQIISRTEGALWKGDEGMLSYFRRKAVAYLDSAEIREKIHSTAKRLVDLRRARAEADLDRWEVYCHGVEYTCSLTRCPEAGKNFGARQELRSHLENIHRVEPGKINSILDKGKRFPLYEPSE